MLKKNTELLLLLLLLSFAARRSAAQGKEYKGFRCNDNTTTIDSTKFCDGSDDCTDKSDEIVSAIRQDFYDELLSCSNANNSHGDSCLVKRALICNEEILCRNLTPCDLGCKTHYRCQESNTCVSRSTICDGIPCKGCPEDHGWNNGVGFKCTRIGRECVLPQQLLYDDVTDCDGGDDLCFDFELTPNRSNLIRSKKTIKPKCFECLDGSMLIPTSRVCDDVIDCSDLSDECLCEGTRPEICDKVIKFGGRTSFEAGVEKSGSGDGSFASDEFGLCDVGMVQCANGSCIPRTSICNGVRDCIDDEKYDYCRGTIHCGDSARYEKQCRCQSDYKKCVVKFGVACDGTEDCDSLSNPFPEDECIANCPVESNSFDCSLSVKQSLSQVLYCEISLDSFLNTSLETISYSADEKCDGVAICPFKDDERDCVNRFTCPAVKVRYISIGVNETCDGFKDCTDVSDETSELCGDERFMCSALGETMVSVEKKLVCDFTKNCDDGSDEFEERNCQDGRFYCENKDPLFIREKQKFDGRQDCSDWTDECPTKNISASRNIFSSRYEMIKIPFLRALVWIMGILSLVGNGAVLIFEAKSLRRAKNRSAVTIANRMLVINLAASDVLMGIYLCGIGIAGLTMMGRYCSKDLIWRSSASCTALGILSVLSSETSVLTMLMLTSCRLFAVLRPFESSTQPRKRIVLCGIILTWATSFTLALIPIIPQLSPTFVQHAEFQSHVFFKNALAPLSEARRTFENLMTYDLKPNVTVSEDFNADSLTWTEMENMGKKLFTHQHFKIEKLFGYYSTDSVCLGKLFVTKSDPAWGFSFAINLLNFCSFLYVALAYVAIYTQSRKGAALRGSASQSKDKAGTDLQRKILRLIITDFCCWMPISILSFVKLAGAYVSNTAYVFAAIILLPINSALNPLLYSVLPDRLHAKIKRCQKRAKPSDASTLTLSSRNSERPKSTITSVEMVSTSVVHRPDQSRLSNNI